MNENYSELSIGERIILMLKSVNKNQTQISKEIEISKNAMSNYVNGNRVPDTMTCLKLSKALGVTMEWLLTGEGNMHNIKTEENNIQQEELSSEEKMILKAYRAMNDEVKDEFQTKVIEMITSEKNKDTVKSTISKITEDELSATKDSYLCENKSEKAI